MEKELNFLNIMLDGNEQKAISFLKENEFDINFTTEPFIYTAISKGMTEVVKIIVNDKFFFPQKDSFGTTEIHHTMYMYYLDANNPDSKNNPCAKEILSFLIDCGKFNLNEIDDNEDTAIMIACTTPDLNWAVEKLLDKEGIDVNQVNDVNFTCVGNAVRRNNFEAARMILKKFPDIQLTESDKEYMEKYGFEV